MLPKSADSASVYDYINIIYIDIIIVIIAYIFYRLITHESVTRKFINHNMKDLADLENKIIILKVDLNKQMKDNTNEIKIELAGKLLEITNKLKIKLAKHSQKIIELNNYSNKKSKTN